VHKIFFHNPRTTPSERKRKKRRKKNELSGHFFGHAKKEEKKTMNLVATSFAMQPVCNAAQVAHALRIQKLVN
jgi:hypothetical protein